MAIHSFRFAISICDFEKQMVSRGSRRYWTVVKGKLTSISSETYTTTHSSKYEYNISVQINVTGKDQLRDWGI